MNEEFEKNINTAKDKAAEEGAGPAAAEAEEKRIAAKSDFFDWVQCIVAALVVCVLVFTFLCRTVGVVGDSMYPTLEWGDRLIISNLFYEPQQGDIIVLRKDTFKEEPIVKRVIATEGQTVEIDFEQGIVYVDGAALDEPYVNSLIAEEQDFTKKVTVPENCVFVLGDNRNASTDSRTASIGCVDERYILGKAIFRITPLSKFGSIY